MDTPSNVEKRIIEGFASAGGAFNQFNYLLQLASELEEMGEDRMVDSALVQGCQSQVWLYVSVDGDGLLRLEGESDTLMVRGVLRILELMFDGQPRDVVAHSDISFIAETELEGIFDMQRKAGIASIVETIRSCARDRTSFPSGALPDISTEEGR